MNARLDPMLPIHSCPCGRVMAWAPESVLGTELHARGLEQLRRFAPLCADCMRVKWETEHATGR